MNCEHSRKTAERETPSANKGDYDCITSCVKLCETSTKFKQYTKLKLTNFPNIITEVYYQSYDMICLLYLTFEPIQSQNAFFKISKCFANGCREWYLLKSLNLWGCEYLLFSYCETAVSRLYKKPQSSGISLKNFNMSVFLFCVCCFFSILDCFFLNVLLISVYHV